MARAKKKKERRVHIDNLHLAKKLDPEYAKLFFDLEDTLLHSGMSDEEIDLIANTALDQLSEGMAKKKKPSLIISPERDFRNWLSKVKHAPAYRQTQRKLRSVERMDDAAAARALPADEPAGPDEA